MTQLPINAQFVVPGIQNFTGIAQLAPESERRNLLDNWADIYFRSINSRANTLSQGGLGWPALDPSTKKKVGARGTDAILVDSLSLIDATRASMRGRGGQLRILNIANMTLTVGIAGGTSGSDERSSRSLGFIYTQHHNGLGNNPIRQIIVPPTVQAQRRMELVARRWMVRQFNRINFSQRGQ